MIRPERLWDQYVAKALSEGMRGSGTWPLQPRPCKLEPPWEEFDGRNLTMWDCILHGWEGSWEGSWLQRLLNRNRPVLPQGYPVVLPELPCDNWTDVVPIVVEQFPEDESTIPKSEEFLRSLPNLTRPISFEIVGIGPEPQFDNSKAIQISREHAAGNKKRSYVDAIKDYAKPYIQVLWTAHRDDAPRLERQLIAHFPNSAVVSGAELDFLRDLNPGNNIEQGRGFAATLIENHCYCWQIRIFTRLDPDPLGVAIAAMSDLGNEEWAVLQILFEPAVSQWSDLLYQAITNPYDGKEFLLPDLQEKQLREKFTSPLFAVSIRIAASTRDVFRQLQGWAQQFTLPPQGFFSTDQHWDSETMPESEQQTLGHSLKARCTFRPGILLNVAELASLVHLPGRAVTSDRLKKVKHRTREAEVVSAEDGSVVLGENLHRGKSRTVRVPSKLRPGHCYVAGATGTGKSTMLLNVIMQDIGSNQGVGVLDPHGDLIRAVLRQIPKHRVKDVILFDPTDDDFPFPLNLLDAHDEKERERIVAETVMSMERYFPSNWGPRLAQILEFTLYTVLESIPGATLADIERMLMDEEFRDQVISKLPTGRLRDYWKMVFKHYPKNAVDPVLNKISPFLVNRTVRNIICQRHSGINFDELLNGGKILLANLSSGMLSERIAGMLGSFLMTKIISATFRRSSIPEDRRRPWYLYIDEFQSFMNLSVGFDKILTEARKFKLVLCMANQFTGQLTPAVRQAIFGNVHLLAFFRMGVDDSSMVAKELGVFTPNEILNLGVGQALVRPLLASATFNLQATPPPSVPAEDYTNSIIERMRTKVARPRATVEKEILTRPFGDILEEPDGRSENVPGDPDEDEFTQ